MGDRRIDRIKRILEKAPNRRMSVSELHKILQSEEKNNNLALSQIHIAINQENARAESEGKASLPYITFKNGGTWGFVSLGPESSFVEGTLGYKIEQEIEKANKAAEGQLRKYLSEMSWLEFESNFLTTILDALGFSDVEITQPVRDGGVDGRVKYKRGIVHASAIVSAKHWQYNSVSDEEVKKMRGIRGEEDTAIIVTSGRITQSAREEAKPSQNARVVYLIDGDQLVEVCKTKQIIFKRATLPAIYVLDVLKTASDNSELEADQDSVAEDKYKLKRVNDSHLGDKEKGLSVQDLANLTGLTVGTVQVYLSYDLRRKELRARINSDPKIKNKALKIMEKKRR